MKNRFLLGDLDIPMRPHRHRLEKGTFGPGENTTSDPNLFLTKHSQPSLPPRSPLSFFPLVFLTDVIVIVSSEAWI